MAAEIPPTPVRELTGFALDVLGTSLFLSLSRNPLKSDEEHLKSKEADFIELVRSVPGVITTQRFSVAGNKACTSRDAAGIFEELYIIPFMGGQDWTGVVVDGNAGISMMDPDVPGNTNRTSVGCNVKSISKPNSSKRSNSVSPSVLRVRSSASVALPAGVRCYFVALFRCSKGHYISPPACQSCRRRRN